MQGVGVGEIGAENVQSNGTFSYVLSIFFYTFMLTCESLSYLLGDIIRSKGIRNNIFSGVEDSNTRLSASQIPIQVANGFEICLGFKTLQNTAAEWETDS
ncbi:hypothetical protein RYX36_005156, partial [Vicia faba]